MNLTLERKLHSSMANQDTYNGVVGTFPLTPRGIYKAARAWRDQTIQDEQSFGNIGMGILKVKLGNKDVTEKVLWAEQWKDTKELL